MIQINAKQQKLQFVKNGPAEYRYVMHVNQYSKLSESKVLDEASASFFTVVGDFFRGKGRKSRFNIKFIYMTT